MPTEDHASKGCEADWSPDCYGAPSVPFCGAPWRHITGIHRSKWDRQAGHVSGHGEQSVLEAESKRGARGGT